MKKVFKMLGILFVLFLLLGRFLPETEVSKNKIKESAVVETRTMGQKNALRSARNYLTTMPFSEKGLIKQLEFEGYKSEDALYGVQNSGADWNEQATKAAEMYLDTQAFSRKGLIEQLIFEGYTQEQATFGVDQMGL